MSAAIKTRSVCSISNLAVQALRLLMMALAAGAAHGQTTVEYIHTDALGTPVAVTDAGGNVIERSEYSPYGELLNRPLTDGPGYTGHVQDATTGLTYMQQRYYDPQIGRFLSVDPIVANANTGGGFNRYTYVLNNPYKFTDPDGRCEKLTGSHICGGGGASRVSVTQIGPPSVRSGDNAPGVSKNENKSSSIAYNAPPPRTVPAGGDNKEALTCVADCTNSESLLVTGGAEQSGHSRNSLHYQDKAVDIPGSPFNKLNHNEVMQCARSCGYTNGWWEVKGSPFKDHWHLQIGSGSGVPAIPEMPIRSVFMPNAIEGGATYRYYDSQFDSQQLNALRSR